MKEGSPSFLPSFLTRKEEGLRKEGGRGGMEEGRTGGRKEGKTEGRKET